MAERIRVTPTTRQVDRNARADAALLDAIDAELGTGNRAARRTRTGEDGRSRERQAPKLAPGIRATYHRSPASYTLSASQLQDLLARVRQGDVRASLSLTLPVSPADAKAGANGSGGQHPDSAAERSRTHDSIWAAGITGRDTEGDGRREQRRRRHAKGAARRSGINTESREPRPRDRIELTIAARTPTNASPSTGPAGNGATPKRGPDQGRHPDQGPITVTAAISIHALICSMLPAGHIDAETMRNIRRAIKSARMPGNIRLAGAGATTHLIATMTQTGSAAAIAAVLRAALVPQIIAAARNIHRWFRRLNVKRTRTTAHARRTERNTEQNAERNAERTAQRQAKRQQQNRKQRQKRKAQRRGLARGR